MKDLKMAITSVPNTRGNNTRKKCGHTFIAEFFKHDAVFGVENTVEPLSEIIFEVDERGHISYQKDSLHGRMKCLHKHFKGRPSHLSTY